MGVHKVDEKISLITVSYNSAATLRDTFDSVKKQDYKNIEYIFVDGKSTDGTISLVQQYSDILTHSTSEPDRGIYDAMNKGVSQATGSIIGILNSDDFYLHDRVLREVADIFEADPELDVVFGDVDFVNDDNLKKVVRTYRAGVFRPWMLHFGFMPPHPAAFIKRAAYERIGLYKIEYRIAADFEFMIRLLLIGNVKYKLSHKVWVRMRTGGASTSGVKSNIISTKEMLRALRGNGFFSNFFILLLRLPYKLIVQVIGK